MTEHNHSLLESATRIRYRVLIWLSGGAVLAYVCRLSVGVAESSIRDQLELTKTQMGWFLGSFYWAYALFQIPAGYLGRRFGTRATLAWCGMAWAAAITLLGMAHSLEELIAAQVLMGLAQAGLFTCSVNSISVWVPESNRATACAALTIGMQFGAILTASLTGILMETWSWRIVLIGYAFPSVFWAMGFLFRFHNHPDQDAKLNDQERRLIRPEGSRLNSSADSEDADRTTPWLAILQNRSILCLCGQQAFRAAGYAFFSTWFPSFLQETRGVRIKDSGLLQGATLAASLCGGLLGGIVVDYVNQRTKNLKLSRAGVGAVCMFCTGILLGCAYFAESTWTMILLIDLGAFLAALAGPCAYVTTIDLGKQHVPAVFSLMNMCGNLAAAIAPILIGHLFDTTQNWNLVLALYGPAYLLATVCWWLVDPRDAILPSDASDEKAE